MSHRIITAAFKQALNPTTDLLHGSLLHSNLNFFFTSNTLTDSPVNELCILRKCLLLFKRWVFLIQLYPPSIDFQRKPSFVISSWNFTLKFVCFCTLINIGNTLGLSGYQINSTEKHFIAASFSEYTYKFCLGESYPGHARDFAWYHGQRPSPARMIKMSHNNNSRTQKCGGFVA